jgi:hypothetical protein
MKQTSVRKISSVAFSNCTIDLVSGEPYEGILSLAVSTDSKILIQPHFEMTLPNGSTSVTYVPVEMDASVRKAMRFPSGASEFGSSSQLLDEVRKSILEYTHLPESSAFLASYAVLSSWFPEALSSAICLAICGPSCPQRDQLFRVLSCMYRRALLLNEINLGALSSLPLDLSPSLFVEHFDDTPRTQKALRATLTRSYFPSKGRLVPTSCMTVISTDEPMIGAAIPGWNIVEIPVNNIRTSPPFLTSDAQLKIAESLQPKLLMYRLKNFSQVKNSIFDGAPLESPVRELARGLGACVVDDADRQQELVRLLKDKEEEALQDMSWEPRVTVLEALLSLCHEAARESVHVGEVTTVANEILRQNGEMLEMTPRIVGSKLRSLGLTTSRLNSEGRGFLLTKENRKRIHKLAFDYRIELPHMTKEPCQECLEIERQQEIDNELDSKMDLQNING